MAQTPLRGRGSKKCPHHFGYDFIYVCENCDNLACVQCVSKLHKGHDLETLSDVVPDIIQNIQDVIRTVERDNIPLIAEKLQAIDDDVSKTRQHCQTQISKVKGQNIRLKQELDDIAEELIKVYQVLEQENVKALLENSIDLQRHLDDLNSQIQMCRDTLQSGNDALIFDISRDNAITLTDVPTPSSFDLPEFLPGDISLQYLEQLIGSMSDKNREPKQSSMNQASQLLVDDGHLNQQLGDWRVTSQFKPYEDRVVTSMHAAASDRVWMCAYACNSDMLLTDHLGNVQEVLDTRWVSDFCISTKSNIWYYQINSIDISMVHWDPFQFQAQTTPESICATGDDHIILGHRNHLAKYTFAGKVICKTASGLFKSPVVREPIRIMECPVTQNLAVIDKDGRNYKGTDKPRVAILDKDLQRLYTYHGLREGNEPPPKPFCPQNLCYTGSGDLVITDRYNNAVILINGKGEYMKTIYTCREKNVKPFAVCVKSDDTIFVSFDDRSVRVLKPK